MPIIDKAFWLIAIAITLANAYFLWSRAKAEVARNPELKTGYNKLLKGFLILANVPWLIMGFAVLVGGVQSAFEYLEPRAGNPCVIAFHVTGLTLWGLTVFWIYFAGGAEFLVRHPGLMNVDVKSVFILKLLFALMLVAGMVAEIDIWSGSFPLAPLQR